MSTINSETDLLFDLEDKSSIGFVSLSVRKTSNANFLDNSLGVPRMNRTVLIPVVYPHLGGFKYSLRAGV